MVLLVAHLAELDTRDVHLRAGHGSLFAYCRDVLALSEQEAFNRVAVARAARRFPVVLEMLEAGALNSTTVRLLAPRLTFDNHRAALESARGKSRLQVEELAARLWPRPDVPSFVRKLPAPSRPAAPPLEAQAPLSPRAPSAPEVSPPPGLRPPASASGEPPFVVPSPQSSTPAPVSPVVTTAPPFPGSRPSVRPTSLHSHPTATRSRSPSGAKPSRSCAARRTFCAMPSPRETRPPSWTAPSRPCWHFSRKGSSQPPSDRGERRARPPDRATSPPRSSARCGGATWGAARSWGRAAAAAQSAASWNSITSAPTPRAVRPR